MSVTQAPPSRTRDAEPDPTPQRPRRSRSHPLIAVVAVATFVATFAVTVVAAVVGTQDIFLMNADEAVAAMLSRSALDGHLTVLFPGNSYQGLVELPLYLVLDLLPGPQFVALRVLHAAIWYAAVGLWTWIALDLVGRRVALSSTARWWGAFAVAGLLTLSSYVGVHAWSRIYPGYHSGAALAALALIVATRAGSGRSWFLAGVLAGGAVYAQPMHVVGIATVLAAWAVADRRRTADLGWSLGGIALGVSPLVLWNLAAGWPVLDAQPVQHPDWTHLDRLANSARLTGRVLWGDGSGTMIGPVTLGPVGTLAMVVCAVVLVLLGGTGLVAMLRSWRSSLPLLVAFAVPVLGLPVLATFSLDSDPRYVVAWWPSLVVAVAVGTATLVAGTRGRVRHVVMVLVVAAVAAQAVVFVDGSRDLLAERAGLTAPHEAARELSGLLRRCGVDSVSGDYWRVYPVLWGYDGDLAVEVTNGSPRLSWFDRNGGPGRHAHLPADTADLARVAAEARALTGAPDWTPVSDRATGIVLVVEGTPESLPAGCAAG